MRKASYGWGAYQPPAPPETSFNSQYGLHGYDAENNQFMSDSQNYYQRDDGKMALTPQASAGFSRYRNDRNGGGGDPGPVDQSSALGIMQSLSNMPQLEEALAMQREPRRIGEDWEGIFNRGNKQQERIEPSRFWQNWRNN